MIVVRVGHFPLGLSGIFSPRELWTARRGLPRPRAALRPQYQPLINHHKFQVLQSSTINDTCFNGWLTMNQLHSIIVKRPPLTTLGCYTPCHASPAQLGHPTAASPHHPCLVSRTNPGAQSPSARSGGTVWIIMEGWVINQPTNG